MRAWLNRNAQPLQAVGALATAMAALTALIVVPYQVSQADRIQRDQTAREIYREFLNLTMQNPRLASANYCALPAGVAETSYTAYVDYLIYTTEQMVETSDDWRAPMTGYLRDHMTYLCTADSPAHRDPGVRGLMADLGLECTEVAVCD